MLHPHKASNDESADEGEEGEMEKDYKIAKINCENCRIHQDKILKQQKRIHNQKKRRDGLKAHNAEQEV